LIAGAAVFLLYVVTLAPTTAFWDTSEYIATAHTLGIPHQPGNPLFVILARAWEILLAPLGLSVAVRTNLFSAFVSATAHGLWFLVVHHILGYFSSDRRFRIAGAMVAVLISATAFTVWNQSNVNKKVYTVALLTIALLTWLTFRWQERVGEVDRRAGAPEGQARVRDGLGAGQTRAKAGRTRAGAGQRPAAAGRDDNLLVLMAFILALSVGNHLMAFLAAPAIVVFILFVRPRTMLNWKLYPAVLAVAVVGLSVHLYLPVRAALGPVINQTDPTCPGIGSALTAIVTYGKYGCVALGESLTRAQFSAPPDPENLPRMLALSWDLTQPRTPQIFLAQLLHYFQFFDWQWSRAVQGNNVLLASLRFPFTLLFLLLGVWGAVVHHRRDRASLLYFLVLFSTLSLGLVVYLNFEYGYSIGPDLGNFDFHEVRERDYFFVASFSVWGLWAGVGLVAIWDWLARNRLGTLMKASPILRVAKTRRSD
jgi:hypothetical protein